jgi:uncharacterized protein (TIGR03435 family)
MSSLRLIPLLAFVATMTIAHCQQKAPVFDAASVRPSQTSVGPDYNNQLSYPGSSFLAKNATLERLIAEAWGIQLKQVSGPAWIAHNEYDIQARAADGTTPVQRAQMLRTLLLERFQLKQHTETRNMRVYVLEVAKTGAKLRATSDGVGAKPGPGFPFHGDMRQFADLLAVQFSIPAMDNPNVPAKAGGPAIPVIDKTGLEGTYDFTVDIHPELGTDAFTAWQRALADQLGLQIQSRKTDVNVVVVDDALKMPAEN